MTDYLVERPREERIEAPTPGWRRYYPLLAVEVALAYVALGWMGVGLWTGLLHPASPAGNAFGAAAKFTGSWVALTIMLAVAAVTSIVGMVIDHRPLRRLGLAVSAFDWFFIAAGLSTTGVVSTAVVVYPSLGCLAVATWLTVPGDRRER